MKANLVEISYNQSPLNECESRMYLAIFHYDLEHIKHMTYLLEEVSVEAANVRKQCNALDMYNTYKQYVPNPNPTHYPSPPLMTVSCNTSQVFRKSPYSFPVYTSS